MSRLRELLISEGILRTARRPSLSERDDIDEQYDDVPRDQKGLLLPRMDGLKKVKKVVVGPKGRHQSPELTREGNRIFKEITGDRYDSYETPRHHPALVWMAETMPDWFQGGAFRVKRVPGGVYEIRRYDSMEWIVTPNSVDWVKI